MHEHYHIDMSEPGLLDRKSKRWLQVRVNGLRIIKSRLNHALYPPTEEEST